MPAIAQIQVQSARVGSDWFDYRIAWTGQAPSYHAKWTVRVLSRGILIVCGAGAHRGAERRHNEDILKDLVFYIGDQAVMSDMSFLTPVSNRPAIKSATATCVSTGKRASNHKSTEVSLRSGNPDKRYRF